MTLAVGTNLQLAWIEESAWGTTPATPTMLALRVTGITPKYTQSTTESKELTTAREIADYIRTDRKGGLAFTFEMSYGNLDGVLENLHGAAWSSDVLKVGTTRKSHSVELGFLDIGQYCLFPGAMYTSLSINVQRGNIITGSAEFLSKTPVWSTSSAATAVTAAETNNVMDPLASVQLLQEGGSGSIANPQEFTLQYTNGIIEFPQLSSPDPADLQLGQLKVEGSFSQYFADRTEIDKVLSYVDTSVAATIGGASSKKYAFLFNSAKLNSVDVSGLSVNSAVVAKIGFAGKFDATHTSSEITRTA